jgi:very-short-patch-repair endonuclease
MKFQKGHQINKGKKHSEKTRLLMRESHLNKKYKSMSECGRINIGLACIGRHSSRKGVILSEVIKQKIRDSALLQFKNGMPEVTKQKIGLANIGKNKGKKYSKEKYPNWGLRAFRNDLVLPIKDTSIEIKIQNFLGELKIEYFKHKYMNIAHSYQCDIFIPSKNIVIECDGNYWHSYPTGTEIDNIRTKELIEKGFKVLRLWENEIRVMNLDDFKHKLETIKNE